MDLLNKQSNCTTINNRNYTIDFCKFIASLFIVAIHVGLFSDIQEELGFIAVHIICRLAVPFFAICTGYFLSSKLKFADKMLKSPENTRIFLSHWKRYILLYAIWTILYLFFSIPNWIQTGWFSAWAFVDYGICAVLNGSHYHLWYLLSLIYAIPFLYVCLRWIKTKYLLLPAAFLYGIKIISYAYRNWLPYSCKHLFDLLDKGSCLTDAVICILPFLLIGVFINKCEKKKSNNWIGFAVSFALLVSEAFLLKSSGQEKFSYIIFTFPASYFLFNALVNIKKIGIKNSVCAQLGAVSLIIYCIHPMFVETICKHIDNSTLNFVITTIISTLLGLLYVKIKHIIKTKKSR